MAEARGSRYQVKRGKRDGQTNWDAMGDLEVVVGRVVEQSCRASERADACFCAYL
jgi:hypothetical protein